MADECLEEGDQEGPMDNKTPVPENVAQEILDEFVHELGYSIPVEVLNPVKIKLKKPLGEYDWEDDSTYYMQGVPIGEKMICITDSESREIIIDGSYILREGRDFEFDTSEKDKRERLQRFLGRCVENELYEKAAEIRDKIDKIEA